MSAFSRRIAAGKPTPPEHRQLSHHVQFRQPTTTVRCHQNSSKLQLTKNQRLGLINHQINHDRRIIEVRSDGGELKQRTWKTTPSSLFICRVADSIVHHDDNHEDDDQHLHHGDEKEEKDQTVEVMVAAGVTVVLGVANRVLYKLALVPLKHYPFFLAQFATFGYVAVYFFILFLRHRAGFVTKEMLSLPQAPFLAVGLLEALAAASGMAAGTMLSGASIPILSQTFLVWQLLLSVIFLGRRYNVNQIVGCLLVSMGVIITVTSGSGAGPSLNQTSIFWSILMIFSFLLQAGDTILKEVIFLDAADRLKEGTVDIFVVNSFGSAYQALFICLLLPFLSKMWGIPFSQLPSYLKDGAACFLNVNSLSTGCNGAPLLPVLFVVVNMCFNISLLHLIRISSAVVSCLASTVSVPLSVFVFTLPLPYLGAGTTLPPGFVAGAVVLLLGLFFYSWKPAMVPAPAASATTS